MSRNQFRRTIFQKMTINGRKIRPYSKGMKWVIARGKRSASKKLAANAANRAGKKAFRNALHREMMSQINEIGGKSND